jgi:2-keto-4-pentenoate hydratase/2-oxohepta-3-ene-1,7-dioic acid hydratase in catechol pathway
MQIIRYIPKGADAPCFGWLNEGLVGEIEGDIYSEFIRKEAVIPLEEVTLLTPVTPSKIICVSMNYSARQIEYEEDETDQPLVFLKPPSSLVGPYDEIIIPPQAFIVEHEAELGVVIRKQGRWIEFDQVKDHIFGYTIANDVTARDIQETDKHWTRAKGFDTFCPVGPCIDTSFRPLDAVIKCQVNEEVKQFSSLSQMGFSGEQIIVYLSSIMTLEPGDLILTGTPAGTSQIQDGDLVRISIEGLGEIRNKVINFERV